MGENFANNISEKQVLEMYANAKAIDEQRFQMLADSLGDSAFLEEKVAEFLKELPAKFKDFPEQLVGKQFDEIAHECHKYRSTSGLFGLGQLSADLLLLEKAAQDRNPADTMHLLAVIQTDLENAGISVAALLKKARDE